jgi:two-component system OmpR family sensor kinase
VTLRLRLVIALVALVTVGLVVFGVTTYTFYARDRQRRLDTQLRNSEPLIDAQLDARASGSLGPPPGAGPGGGPGGPPIDIPSGTFAELRNAAGKVVSQIQNSTHLPRLPNPLPAPTPHGRLFTVGSTSGSGRFRVLLSPGRDGGTTVIAASTSEITDALHQLVLLEVGGGLILLVVLSAGSWLILRRGLRPLERMAGTARSITAGDLSQRVSPSGGASEVGQLGLALNTMLDGIEGAFEERDATEQRLRQFLADV